MFTFAGCILISKNEIKLIYKNSRIMKKFITKPIYIALMAMLCTVNLTAQEPLEIHHITVLANPAQGCGGHVVGSGTYLHGASAVVIATSIGICDFINWTEEGVEVSTEAVYHFIVESDRNLVANFVPITYNITLLANPPEGGAVFSNGIPGGGTYQFGDSVVVAVISNTGWTFIDWTKDGIQISTALTFLFTVEESCTLVANFAIVEEPELYEIILFPDPLEGGFVFGSGGYLQGTTATVMAIPNTGWHFIDWTEEGIEVSTEAVYHFIVESDRTLVANFCTGTTPFEITLSANPAEGGVVSGDGMYYCGDSVVLNAIPIAECYFINWTDENGDMITTEPTFWFIATESRTLVANFSIETELEVTILVNVPGGEVLGGGVYHYGDEVTVEAIPHSGYLFVNWTEGRGVVSTDNPYRFTVTESMVLVANFEEGVLSIEPIDAGAMTIYPNPTNSDMTVILNDSALKITAMELYDLVGRKVYQQTVNESYGTLKMNEMAQGIYVLKVLLDNGETAIRKIVKE
jgi:hypothetical protein